MLEDKVKIVGSRRGKVGDHTGASGRCWVAFNGHGVIIIRL